MAHYRTRAWRVAFALAALAAVALFCMLGAWQHRRGVEKQRLLDEQERAMQSTQALPLASALDDDAQSVRRVAGEVRYRPPLMLLDGQSRNGRVGVRAYAVAQSDDRGVLVDLGWLPLGADRALPAVPVPTATQAEGLLAPWPGQGLRAAANPWREGASPVLLTYLDRAEIERATGLSLAASVLRLDPDAGYGYERDRQLLPNTLPPERHFGYSLQWYALAATVALVWAVLTWRSLRKGKTA